MSLVKVGLTHLLGVFNKAKYPIIVESAIHFVYWLTELTGILILEQAENWLNKKIVPTWASICKLVGKSRSNLLQMR